ncbi:MAG TPA: LacI family DNA-binding transcriptional regulator [Streptosporangiaceae bacterium]|jgi:LacI family transcriptional regulator|nr:LacI family DNA-binding transcriptional regulator [Streptosporangiaceae bacterium]
MRNSRRATISDVAAASGVGVGTVSRVINGAANVRQATRDHVLKVIDQLGYRPSHLAAALSRGTQRSVAIVVPHLTRPSVVERLAGALAVLDAEEYDTVVCSADSPARRDSFLAALTRKDRTDGVIIMSLPISQPQLAAVRRASIPLVAVDVTLRGVPQTVIDDTAGGRLAAEHLLSLGHQRIGFVGDLVRRMTKSSFGFTASEQRLAGYREALAAAGLPRCQSLIRLGPYGAANAEALTTELLKLPDPPTAIFASSDTQAMGVLAAADRMGLRVPGELSVVGFDDIELAALIGLTTVRQPLEQSGVEGARRLSALLRGEQVTPLRQVLDLQVVQRNTSTHPRPARQAGSGRAVAAEGIAAAERHYRADGRGMPRAGCVASGHRAGLAQLRRRT